MRDCSSTAERAVKSALSAANPECHLQFKSQRSPGLSFAKVVFLASGLSSFTTAGLPVDYGYRQV
jgi:hypothetical protein